MREHTEGEEEDARGGVDLVGSVLKIDGGLSISIQIKPAHLDWLHCFSETFRQSIVCFFIPTSVLSLIWFHSYCEQVFYDDEVKATFSFITIYNHLYHISFTHF